MKVSYRGIEKQLPSKLQEKLDAKFAKLSKMIEKRGEKEPSPAAGAVTGRQLIELCLTLGDVADQAAWLCWVGTTSMPSANLTPAMIFGN